MYNRNYYDDEYPVINLKLDIKFDESKYINLADYLIKEEINMDWACISTKTVVMNSGLINQGSKKGLHTVFAHFDLDDNPTNPLLNDYYLLRARCSNTNKWFDFKTKNQQLYVHKIEGWHISCQVSTQRPRYTIQGLYSTIPNYNKLLKDESLEQEVKIICEELLKWIPSSKYNSNGGSKLVEIQKKIEMIRMIGGKTLEQNRNILESIYYKLISNQEQIVRE